MRTDDDSRNFVTWGWIGAFLFAPLGLVMSVILMTKGRFGHAFAIFAICCFWLLIVLDSTPTAAP